MYRFELYSGAALIGWSNLEAGDPPMGVAFGTFVPSPAFDTILSTATDNLGNQVYRDVTVHSGDGEVPNEGGVAFVDGTNRSGPGACEVTVYGIPYPLYEILFSLHVEEYRRRLSASV
jgi:hypothetical protein